ncbi:hypothetical protein HELRODRAFT_170874 [Helobdella robusta]|uniref:Uncharacterized protein n=1 Tax=Helobdella robusta TaxID=6412 RepID=T1F3J2_HELRO|nr:hypothetical protein HELRODRAFT_170874 [Helobdella robusta]ESO06849.1 hypothetical protein HELRODRAFT_170874 [Helobdella robusta]
MNKGRKITKECSQCLKHVPSARKSCSECGFKFVREVENLTASTTTTPSTSNESTSPNKSAIENRTRRRCREKPHFFDSTEYNTTIKKRKKTLVRKFPDEPESKEFEKSRDQGNSPKAYDEKPNSTSPTGASSVKDEKSKPNLNLTNIKEESSTTTTATTTTSNSSQSTSDTRVSVNGGKNCKDKDIHNSNILSEINRRILSISCQPCI